MRETIEHIGTIEKIEGNHIFVRIVQQSACSGCHAKTICTASESQEKTIEVTDYTHAYQLHERVMLYGRSSLGLQAVLIAFVIPLVIMLATIIIGTYLHWEEALSGMSGIAILIPYYATLYFLRDKLKKKFVFTLKKLN